MNQQVVDSAVLRDRFDLDVIPLRFAASIADLGAPSLRKVARAAGILAAITRSVTTRRPDALYLTLALRGPAFVRDCAIIGLARALRVPLILHLHARAPTADQPGRVPRALYAWAFRGAHVLLLSERLAGDVAGLAPATRVRVVPNGIPDRAAGVARTPRAPAQPPRVLFLSNLIASKGPFVLLEALGLLRARGLHVEATFAGAAGSAAALAEFEARRARLGLTERVRYVGAVHGEDKDRLLRDHDVFCFPSLDEAFGLVLLEAMMWQLPVVATLEGGIPDIVSEGVTGFLVPPRDAHALAERLATLCAAPELRDRLGRAGRARFLERFTLATFERDLADALASCLTQEPPTR